jgi:hypothetical protein
VNKQAETFLVKSAEENMMSSVCRKYDALLGTDKDPNDFPFASNEFHW